jgi:adenylate cyclase
MRDAPTVPVIVLVLLLAAAGATAVLTGSKAWHSVLAFAVFLPMPAALGMTAYARGLWWPVVVQETGVALALVSAVVINYATEGRKRAYYKQAFKQYLSPAVIDKILADPSQLKLGGERRELTIFFSDLHRFSAISERLDPALLTSLLNDYLSDMTAIILEEGGTLDKYVGDAVIAFWNAPLTQPDHAIRACRAALRCQQKLIERRDEFVRRTGAALQMRIGIHTGEVVVGNLGSHQRFNYTVLGDAANLASRLEGANKAFGTSIMISEATWLQTEGRINGREIGLVRVVGRQAPVRVYEIAGSNGEPLAEHGQKLQEAICLCRDGKWTAALEIFAAYPDDSVAKVYTERCRMLLADPASFWDGIWNLTQK